jgi:inorganic pyrophosphatase
MANDDKALGDLLSQLFQAHPWHGVAPFHESPAVVNAYIEIVPTDAVKYELDKPTGHLRVDRPQRFSSMCPTPYGFIPQTFCGDRVAELCESRTGRKGLRGDGDPMDICVLTERPAAHGDFFVRAVPVGGLRMIDGDEAQDDAPRRVEIADVYDRAEAADVIRRSAADYRARYGAPETRIAELRRLLTS